VSPVSKHGRRKTVGKKEPGLDHRQARLYPTLSFLRGSARQLGKTPPVPECRGVVRRFGLGYPAALSFSTILLAAAPEELFC
jgi:hypothetical protein